MKHWIFIAGIILLFSCQKIEKIEKAGSIQARLIVNCVLRNDDYFVIHVNKSLSALDNAPMKTVKNAVVKIFKDGVFWDTAKFDLTEDAYLSSKELPKTGVHYSLEVSAPGMELVKCSALLPQPVLISQQSLVVKEKTKDSFEYGAGWLYVGYFKSASLRISFQDIPKESNFYMLTIKDNWKDNGSSGRYYFGPQWLSDRLGMEVVNGQNANRYDNVNYYFFRDDLDDGKTIDLEFHTAPNYGYNFYLNEEDSLLSYTISLYSFTEDYSKHLYTLSLSQQNEGNPFEEPVQIFSNVQKGYGVFGGLSLTEKDIPFPY